MEYGDLVKSILILVLVLMTSLGADGNETK